MLARCWQGAGTATKGAVTKGKVTKGKVTMGTVAMGTVTKTYRQTGFLAPVMRRPISMCPIHNSTHHTTQDTQQHTAPHNAGHSTRHTVPHNAGHASIHSTQVGNRFNLPSHPWTSTQTLKSPKSLKPSTPSCLPTQWLAPMILTPCPYDPIRPRAYQRNG